MYYRAVEMTPERLAEFKIKRDELPLNTNLRGCVTCDHADNTWIVDRDDPIRTTSKHLLRCPPEHQMEAKMMQKCSHYL